MIILQVHIDGIFPVEGKSQSVIPRHATGIPALHRALERMESPPGQVHVPGPLGDIQSVQHALDALHAIRRNSPGIALAKEPFQTLVPEGANHRGEGTL